MRYSFFLTLLVLICFSFPAIGHAQENNVQEGQTDEEDGSASLHHDTPQPAEQSETPENQPVILYNGTPKKYEIADIKVEGVKNYEDYVLIGISGLAVGQTITVPGDDITDAVKRYWRHGLFSDVRISADKIEGNKIWIRIELTQRPRIADIHFNGIKKGEREDLQNKLGNMVKGMQITPNMVDRAKIIIKKYFDEKGFKNAEINIIERQ